MTETRRRLALMHCAPPLVVAFLSGCAAFSRPPPPPPPPPPTVSIARLYDQPAERAFINGLRFYEEGQYERAEALLKRSLAEGLSDGHDVAVAQKHLAFIACAYNRPGDCEQAFRAAFVADPSFRLTDAEVGHPLWGPVYKRVAAEQPRDRPPVSESPTPRGCARTTNGQRLTVFSHEPFVAVRLRAAAPEAARLISRSECTCEPEARVHEDRLN